MSNILNNPTYFSEDNTVAYYKLDGNTNATIGSDWVWTNVTWVDSARWYTSEVWSFNGSSSYIHSVYSLRWVNTFTLSMWVKFNNVNTYQWLYSLQYTWSSIEAWLIRLNLDWTLYFSDQVAWWFNSNNTFIAWKYYFIQLIRKTATTWEFWIDWKLDSSHTYSISTPSSITGTWPLIWASSTNYWQYLNWNIWEVRICNTVLTEQEIKNLYLQGLRLYGPTANLPTFTTSLSPTAFYPLNWDALDYAWSNDWTWSGSEAYSPVWWWKSATFNWSTDYIDISATLYDNSNSFSISAWVKYDTISDITKIRWYQKWNSSYNGVIMSTWETTDAWKPWFWVYDWSWKYAKFPTASVNWEWYHIVWVYNSTSNTADIYVNWVAWTQATWIWTVTNWTNYHSIWRYFTQEFNWNILLVQIYNTILSQADITKLYNEWAKWILWNKYSLPLLQTDLELHLTWVNNWTTTLYDQSGNAVNWTVSSTPTYYKYWLNTIISLSSQSISWASTTFNTATCWEKVSWTWELQINPAYITTTWVSSWTREITDIRLYSRTLSSEEQDILLYWTFIRTV